MLTAQLSLLAAGFGITSAGIGAVLAMLVCRRKYLAVEAPAGGVQITPEQLAAVIDRTRSARMEQSSDHLTPDQIDILLEAMALIDEARELEPKGGALYDRLDSLHREVDLIIQDFAPAQLHPDHAARLQMEAIDAIEEPNFMQNFMQSS